MKLFAILPVLSFGLLMGGCASLVSGQTQDVTIVTPGATEARCTLDNGIRYVVNTGETIEIMRNESDIVVDCYASGNRHRKMNIQSDGNDWAIGNIATGIIPGVTFDHFSKGLYEYPAVITVDFVGVPTRGFELPDYHNKDAPNPYEQSIENYGPSTPKKNSDRDDVYKTPVKKKMRGDANPFAPATGGAQSGYNPNIGGNVNVSSGITPLPGATSTTSGAIVHPSPAVPQGTLSGSTAEQLTRSMNPTVFHTNN